MEENIGVGGSEQSRDASFRIHLRDLAKVVWALFVAMGFSIFKFPIGIKLFIWHPVVLFSIFILLDEFDDFMQLPPWCILKDRHLCLHKYLKY